VRRPETPWIRPKESAQVAIGAGRARRLIVAKWGTVRTSGNRRRQRPALALYARAGFKPSGRRENYYQRAGGDGCAALNDAVGDMRRGLGKVVSALSGSRMPAMRQIFPLPQPCSCMPKRFPAALSLPKAGRGAQALTDQREPKKPP
jgi:hypothetical protein